MIPSDHFATTADAPTAEVMRPHSGLSSLTPAGRIAALIALRDAIDARVTVEKKALIETLTGATETQSLHTPFGDISFQPGKRRVVIDQDKLLEYVKRVAPEMVETVTVINESVIDSYRETLEDDVVHLGDGDFVRASTGEVIDYAYLSNPSNTNIAYPASKEQKAAKAAARRVVRDNMERFAAPMLEVTDGRR